MGNEISYFTKEIPKLDFFNINNVDKHSSIAVIGLHQTGKTVLIKSFLKHFFEDKGYGLVIAESEKERMGYAEHLPDLLIRDTSEIECLQKLVKRQENLKGRDAFVVIDKLMDSDSAMEEQLDYMNSKNDELNLTYIASLKYPKRVPDGYHLDYDYVFLFGKTDNHHYYEMAYKHCASRYPIDRDSFMTIMINLGEFECLVIDNTHLPTETDIQKIFHIYKVMDRTTLKSFRICSPEIWKSCDIKVRLSAMDIPSCIY